MPGLFSKNYILSLIKEMAIPDIVVPPLITILTLLHPSSFFFNLSIALPNLTTPTINRSKGIKNNRWPIPGANNVTTDKGPNNLGNPIKIINGSSQLNTNIDNPFRILRNVVTLRFD